MSTGAVADDSSSPSPNSRSSERSAGARCFGCGGGDLVPFYAVDDIPVHSVRLMDTRAAALDFPRRDLRLAQCGVCGFIQNTRFEPSLLDYAVEYEETQGFSPRFGGFLDELAARLIERHGLRGKTIVEIGCGKGEFLAALCERGGNRGIGIDPAYVPGRLDPPVAGRIEFLREVLSERHAQLLATADAVICRHTLEHIQDVRAFIGAIRAALADRPETLVVVEVPDVSRILAERAFWDIYYEHCSYFASGSLTRLFQAAGFDASDPYAVFDGQYLVIEARPGDAKPVVTPGPAVADFAVGVSQSIADWRRRLRGVAADGKRAVLWGGGSKAVAFLSTLGLGDEVAAVVDVNPHKQGKFLPGTGHEVVAPEALSQLLPDLVIAMNGIYRAEIQAELDRLAISTELIAV